MSDARAFQVCVCVCVCVPLSGAYIHVTVQTRFEISRYRSAARSCFARAASSLVTNSRLTVDRVKVVSSRWPIDP